MPLTSGSRTATSFTRPEIRATLWLTTLFALVCATPQGAACAQVGRTGSASDQPQTANGASTPARPRRVVVGGTSETADGARQTVRADSSLNDYSAYRSGDRFIIVLPKSAAGGVVRRPTGRGYSDMEVEQRGEDLILTYRLRPGAKPRVEQRFNRLDVVFEVAEGGQPTGPSQSVGQQSEIPSAQQPAPVSPDAGAQAEARRREAVGNVNPGQAVSPSVQQDAGRLAAQKANEPGGSPATGAKEPPASEQAGPGETVSAASSESAEDSGTATDGARSQQSSLESSAALESDPAGGSRASADVGVQLRDYWPLAPVVVLALFGLIVALARRRRRAPGEVDAAGSRVAGLEAVGAAEMTPEDAGRPEALSVRSSFPASVNGADAQAVSVGQLAARPVAGGFTKPGSHETPAHIEPVRPINESPAHPFALPGAGSFEAISVAFDDEDIEMRSAAARALYDLDPDRAESFTRALREAGPERRRRIAEAINSSGLAAHAISQLTGENREQTYEAFSLLFLMARGGEVRPLIRAVESHASDEIRLAVVKLLALSGQKEVLTALRRMAVRGTLTGEVRTAVKEAIYQISSQTDPAPAA